jgi:8-oxo-dGTP pyrophosphatase MutT (NUDIX family)
MATLPVSCGVLLLNARGEILMCHATGGPRWDIPKGIADAGETEREAAVRELAEETGLQLLGEDLRDLGRHKYLRGKDLHLFSTLIERIDTTLCVCTSYFVDTHGKQRPEVDAFAWVPIDQAPSRCGKSLALLLTEKVPLRAVLAALRD